jgi:hypothetical protein
MSGDCLAQLINDRFDQQNSDRKHLLVINVNGKRSPLVWLLLLYNISAGRAPAAAAAAQRARRSIYSIYSLVCFSLQFVFLLISPLRLAIA